MPKKYCIITSSYPRNVSDFTNAGLFVRDFAKELQNQGNEVFVVTPNKTGAKDVNPEVPVCYFKRLGGETDLTSLNIWNPVDLFKIISLFISGSWFTLSKLREEKPDYVLACWAVPSGIFALLAKWFLGIPYSVWILGSDVWNFYKNPLGRLVLKIILRQSTHIYADGYKLADIASSIANRRCIFLSSSRVLNLDDYYEVKVNNNKINFVFVGRLSPVKGPDILIRALAKVSKDEDDIHLYLFGFGELENELKQMVKKLELESLISFKGMANSRDLVSYFRVCDCLIIPSRVDSLPLVFSEGLANRIPMIVTDVGDAATLVNKYSLGLVARGGDVDDLADRMLDFIKNDKKIYLSKMAEVKKIFSLMNSVRTFVSNV